MNPPLQGPAELYYGFRQTDPDGTRHGFTLDTWEQVVDYIESLPPGTKYQVQRITRQPVLKGETPNTESRKTR